MTNIEADMPDDVYHFSNGIDHHFSTINTMKELYDNNELLDITLHVGEKHFDCHRIVLAAISPYFRAMFTTKLNEGRQKEINLYEIDANALELIVQYAYTASIIISKFNAQNLLAIASLFQIESVKLACAKFMESQLDVVNCIGIHYFAHVHGCEDLSAKALEFIEKHFEGVIQCEEFLSLDAPKVSEILSSDELNVDREEVVYEAFLKWLSYSECHKNHIETILPLIRFGLIPSKYISDNILRNEMLSNNDKCSILIRDLHNMDISPESFPSSQAFNNVLRSGMIKPEPCLLFIGGVDQSRCSINCYNPLTREAYYMSDFTDYGCRGFYHDVEYPACVFTSDKQLFVAGGNYIYHEAHGDYLSDEDSLDDYDDETVCKDVYLYDNDHDIWLPKSSMLFPKSNFAMACVNNNIYCFGGLTLNQHPTEIIERYDINSDRWSYVGMMPTPLVDLSAVVFNDIIYVLGGRTGVGTHNVVMKYNTTQHEWTSLAGMPTPRFNFGSCVVGEEIYVAGGQIYAHSNHTISREALKSVEIYSIENNQWRQGLDLPESIFNAGLSYVNKTLYVFGTSGNYRSGHHRHHRYNVVHRLPINGSKWEKVEGFLCDVRDFACITAEIHTRKLSQVFRPDVDT